MYIQRIAENLVQNAFLGFEIFSFEVDAYMYVQKTFFSAVYLSSLHVEEGGRESTPCDLDADPGDPETDPDPVPNYFRCLKGLFAENTLFSSVFSLHSQFFNIWIL
jgi:hypothetical protein